jgi:hypothetical protein
MEYVAPLLPIYDFSSPDTFKRDETGNIVYGTPHWLENEWIMKHYFCCDVIGFGSSEAYDKYKECCSSENSFDQLKYINQSIKRLEIDLNDDAFPLCYFRDGTTSSLKEYITKLIEETTFCSVKEYIYTEMFPTLRPKA